MNMINIITRTHIQHCPPITTASGPRLHEPALALDIGPTLQGLIADHQICIHFHTLSCKS